MPRIQGLAERYLSDNAQLKTGPGEVFSLTLAWTGGAAGLSVILWDSADSGATGTPLARFIFDAASGTIPKEWANGKRFTNGLFVQFNDGIADTSLELTFK